MADIILKTSDLVQAYASDFQFPNQNADNFSLTAGSNTITDVHWWRVYSPSNTVTTPDDFTIRIFADNAEVAATNPLFSFGVGSNVNRTATGNNIFGLNEYSYSADISATALTPGTTYWLSIVNNTVADTDDDGYWETSNQTGVFDIRFNDGDSWQSATNLSINADLAFNLTNDNLPAQSTPEPSSVLGFLAIGGLGLIARRKRQ